MDANVRQEIDHLRELTADQLRKRHEELLGYRPTSLFIGREILIGRIAWELQALAQGELSERAKQRAAEIVSEVELKGQARFRITVAKEHNENGQRVDPRLPPPGRILSKVYRGRTIVVKVLTTGFDWDGQTYTSLSAVARAVTGTRWNGLLFFGRAQRKSAGSARTGSDRSRDRGRDLVSVNGDASIGEVTKFPRRN